MKMLFPELEQGTLLLRLAERREARQRGRDYLKDKAGYENWIIKRLKENGQMPDANMMLEIAELSDLSHGGEALNAAVTMILVAHSMWLIGKLKRREFKNHPCGERCFIYSIRRTN